MSERTEYVWEKALDLEELPDGRVKPITCRHMTVCMTHHEGQYAALDNKCPHQGGPLGEGSIENGWLRCPWHGWDFSPVDGKPPGGFDDGVATFPVEVHVGIIESGGRKLALALARDVSERHEAEQRLERVQMLAQARKMEAVGNLVGV